LLILSNRSVKLSESNPHKYRSLSPRGEAFIYGNLTTDILYDKLPVNNQPANNMTYLYEDYGRPVSLDRERLTHRKFHALGTLQISDLTNPSLLIKEVCELADTNDYQDYKKATKFYRAYPHRWDLGDFETAYCPDCKRITEVAYHSLSDGDYSAECPECSFVFEG